MIERDIDSITKDDIMSLLSNSVAEKRTIEYKREVKIATDSERKEFLADISSLANTAGGDLIIGVEEKNGIPMQAEGIENQADALTLQIESIIRDGIQPRIIGLKTKTIEGFSKGSVLIIRLPKSWNSPHMVSFKGSSRFYVRDSNGKHQMDVSEIRSSFLLAEEIPTRIRLFRDDRVGKIIARETPIRLLPGATIVIHVLPTFSFSQKVELDIRELVRQSLNFRPPFQGISENRINLDGVLAHGRVSESGSPAYWLLFHTGQIEWANANFLATHPATKKKFIPGKNYEEDAIRVIIDSLNLLKTLQVPCPIAIFLSMIGVSGTSIWNSSISCLPQDPCPIDRDNLILPEIIIQDYTTIPDDRSIARAVRPLFDSVWNACGFYRSDNFDAEGNWK